MVGSTVSHYKILEHLGGGGMVVANKAADIYESCTSANEFLLADLERTGDLTQFTHRLWGNSSTSMTGHELDHVGIRFVS